MEHSISKPPGVNLTTKVQLWFIEDIRELLSQANLCVLQNSCFSHFFEFGNLKFQSELLNLLCRRLHASSLDRNVLQFKIANFSVEFGPADFCAMSGLKFSGCPTLPTHSKFHGHAFESQENLVFGDIEREFRKECAETGGHSNKSLKLAYSLIVYGLLLMNEHSSGRIELGYMHLLDDTLKFNDFPWGLVAFENLVKSTHRLKTQLSTGGTENLHTSYEAYGFVYALQCWVYEVIPSIGSFCASMNPDHLTSFPRILRWSFSQNSKSVEEVLWKFFLADHGSNPVRLVLSSREVEKMTVLGINSSMHVASPRPYVDSAKVVGRKLVFDSVERHGDGVKKAESKRKSKRLRDSPNLSINSRLDDVGESAVVGSGGQRNYVPKRKCVASSKSPSCSNVKNCTPDNRSFVGAANLNELMSMVVSMNAQLKSLQDLVARKFNVVEAIIMRLSNQKSSTFCGVSNYAADVEIVGESCKCRDRVDSLQKACYCTQSLGAVEFNCLSSMCTPAELGNDDNKGIGGVVPVEAPKSAKVVFEEQVPSRPRFSHSERMAALSRFDPNENDFQSSELIPYLAWLDTCSKSTRDKLLCLPNEILKYADREWFNVLWSQDGWLFDTHIDALTNLLVLRYDEDSRNVKPRRWTCMEICCWQALRQAEFDDVRHVLMPYVRGERPLRGGVSWSVADHVFGVANINNCHWVMYDISLEGQLITVYNSVAQSWDIIVAHFANVRRNLATICAIGGVWDRCKVKRPSLKKIWDIVEFHKPPRQVNLSDCGIMAMKYMECLAHKVSVYEIDPKKCLESRQRYCAKLFKLSGELRVQNVSDKKK